jgi:hypothetical protein
VGSPFVYEQPVGPADLIDRESAAQGLFDRFIEGRNSRLEAPRRYGKTSLLLKVLEDTRDDDMVPVYVNFLGVLTVGDVTERIERAYRDQLDSRLRRWLSGVLQTTRPTLSTSRALPAGGSVSPLPPDQGLLDRLSLPRRLHERHGRRCAIVFDEFQDVLRAGNEIDAVFRSELEQQGAAAAYAFSGSHPGLMRELFGSRRRGFYGQAGLVELGPLEAEDLAEYIGGRFEARGRDAGPALDPLLATAGGHPQRAMLLAHHLFEHTPPRSRADSDAWQAALEAAARDVDGEVQATWSGFSATQQRLVAVIADGTLTLGGQAARSRYGLPKTGAHRGPLATLEGEGHIVRAESPTGWRLVDPLFGLWLRGGREWPR